MTANDYKILFIFSAIILICLIGFAIFPDILTRSIQDRVQAPRQHMTLYDAVNFYGITFLAMFGLLELMWWINRQRKRRRGK